MLTINPGQETKGPPSGGGQAPLFDLDDIEAIKREISGIKAISPVGSKGVNAVYGNENYSTSSLW